MDFGACHRRLADGVGEGWRLLQNRTAPSQPWSLGSWPGSCPTNLSPSKPIIILAQKFLGQWGTINCVRPDSWGFLLKLLSLVLGKTGFCRIHTEACERFRNLAEVGQAENLSASNSPACLCSAALVQVALCGTPASACPSQHLSSFHFLWSVLPAPESPEGEVRACFVPCVAQVSDLLTVRCHKWAGFVSVPPARGVGWVAWPGGRSTSALKILLLSFPSSRCTPSYSGCFLLFGEQPS